MLSPTGCSSLVLYIIPITVQILSPLLHHIVDTDPPSTGYWCCHLLVVLLLYCTLFQSLYRLSPLLHHIVDTDPPSTGYWCCHLLVVLLLYCTLFQSLYKYLVRYFITLLTQIHHPPSIDVVTYWLFFSCTVHYSNHCTNTQSVTSSHCWHRSTIHRLLMLSPTGCSSLVLYIIPITVQILSPLLHHIVDTDPPSTGYWCCHLLVVLLLYCTLFQSLYKYLVHYFITLLTQIHHPPAIDVVTYWLFFSCTVHYSNHSTDLVRYFITLLTQIHHPQAIDVVTYWLFFSCTVHYSNHCTNT